MTDTRYCPTCGVKPLPTPSQPAHGEALTEAERHVLGCRCSRLDDTWHHKSLCPVPSVERILADRVPAQPAHGDDEAALRAAEAHGAYFAMWQFFLSLPGPTPMSDAVQREAMRLRAALSASAEPECGEER